MKVFDLLKKPKQERKDTTPKETAAPPPIYLKPLITEKATSLAPYRQYQFKVPLASTKKQIAGAVQFHFHVHPTRIRVSRVSGKHVRYGKTSGVTKNWKKATLTLREGEKIELT